jgi:hypothetical protein
VFTCCRGVCLARASLVVAAWRVKKGGRGGAEEGVFFKGKILNDVDAGRDRATPAHEQERRRRTRRTGIL